MTEKSTGEDSASASMIMGACAAEGGRGRGRFKAVCIGADGKEKWREEFDNLVTTAGKNMFVDTFFRGSSYTQTVRMGLAGAGTKAVGDTQGSHAGWNEVGLANAPTYTGDRKDVTLGAASAGVAVSSAQAFAITSTGTVAGCFMNNGGSATKDNTTGTLFSAGDFATSRSVVNGDTINVTYTYTQS